MLHYCRGKIKLATMRIIIAITLLTFTLSVCIATDPNASSNEINKDINNLLILMKREQISKIRLYYSSWQNAPWRPIIREGDLLKQDCDIVEASSYTLINYFTSKLVLAMESYKYEKVQAKDIDFRLGCIFYEKDKEVGKIFFSRNAPVVSINGNLFAATPNILVPFLELLPHIAYEEINHAALRNWMINCAILYNKDDSLASKSHTEPNTNQ